MSPWSVFELNLVQAVRVAVDRLLGATPDEIHDVTEERGWDDLAVADIYAADRNLDATYLIRMFSVFERAIFSYWRLLTGNDVRDAEGDVRLEEVGAACVILQDVIDEAQAVRVHRNNLVHGRIDEHYASMSFEEARANVLTYLGELPEQWG